MAKIKLQPNPTFKAPVAIHVPGGDDAKVTFEFRHRDRDAIKKFSADIGELDDVGIVKLACVGWELDDAFTDDNIKLLLDNYISAARSIVATYYDELLKAKLGN